MISTPGVAIPAFPGLTGPGSRKTRHIHIVLPALFIFVAEGIDIAVVFIVDKTDTKINTLEVRQGIITNDFHFRKLKFNAFVLSIEPKPRSENTTYEIQSLIPN